MKAIIIYGPPGSGKGTQANLLELTDSFIHFDTGKYLENILADQVALKKSKELREQKKLFDSGRLLSPPFVLKIVKRRTAELARGSLNVVFSGSPRTVFEAFGDSKTESFISFLEKRYSKKNVSVFLLDVKSATSIKRNSGRLICLTC